MTGSEIKRKLAKSMDKLASRINAAKDYKFTVASGNDYGTYIRDATEKEIQYCIDTFFSGAVFYGDRIEIQR